MKLSHATGYALASLAYLARNGDGTPIAAHDIAAAQGLSEKFLPKALKALMSAGILRSVKGRLGGYQLARPAGDITLLAVVEAVEGPVRGAAAWVGNEGAAALDRRLQVACEDAAGVVRRGLGGVTVKDLAGGKKGR